MKDDRRKFEEFAELAGHSKEHLLHRLGQQAKPEGPSLFDSYPGWPDR